MFMKRWAFIRVRGGILAMDNESVSLVFAIRRRRLEPLFLIGSRLVLLTTQWPLMPLAGVIWASYLVLRLPTNIVVPLVEFSFCCLYPKFSGRRYWPAAYAYSGSSSSASAIISSKSLSSLSSSRRLFSDYSVNYRCLCGRAISLSNDAMVVFKND